MPIVKTDLKEVPMEEVAAKAAQLSISSVGINKQVQLLSEEFGFNFSRRQIERLRTKDVYQRVVKEYTDNVVKAAVSELKREASNLVPLVTEALKKALETGNINAVPHTLKILGIDEKDAGDSKSQSLTVVLPGATPPKERIVSES